MKKLKITLMLLTVMAIGLTFTQEAYSQNICNEFVACTTDADCQDFSNSAIALGGCPPCMGCVEGLCQPKDSLCDDGNPCTTDLCFFDDSLQPPFEANGCRYLSPATSVPPDPNLPIQCYLCEPTANNVLVDNGICDQAAGENCSNSTDCQEAGVPCGTPPTPPLNCQPNTTDPQPVCQDGDRCTDDVCTIVGAAAPVGECSNPPKGCEAVPDGCCPSNCDGPNPNPQAGEEPCFDGNGVPIPGCDADCWLPQACGDGQVQPPETCDDSANQGDAGISPTGAIVSNETCRDQGTPAECTYCGDGIIQGDAGEQCDLNQNGVCGAEGCNLSTCQCNVTDICLSGSGNIWDTLRPGCGNCSLNKDAMATGFWQDYAPYLGLGLLLIAGLWLRRRPVH